MDLMVHIWAPQLAVNPLIYRSPTKYQASQRILRSLTLGVPTFFYRPLQFAFCSWLINQIKHPHLSAVKSAIKLLGVNYLIRLPRRRTCVLWAILPLLARCVLLTKRFTSICSNYSSFFAIVFLFLFAILQL